MSTISVSAPGRICLFGEDVDYMGLEVIAIGINKRIEIRGKLTERNKINVKLEDIGSQIQFTNQKQKLRRRRDYVKSVYNLFYPHIPNNFGADIHVKSSIPIGKGLSSSSAFCTAFVGFFSKATDSNLLPQEIAQLAYKAEVLKFGEPGGMMDHYASALGGTVYLECRKPYNFQKLLTKINGLVVGDTLVKKETINTLTRRKEEIMLGIEQMKKIDETFSVQNYSLEKVEEHFEEKQTIGLKRLIGILGIRNVVREGYTLLQKERLDEKKLSKLITQHHTFQAENLENVIEKMDILVEEAKNAGAKACKLLGSGNGGSFLAYAPRKEMQVIEAINKAGEELKKYSKTLEFR